jgi:hypothetical protein
MTGRGASITALMPWNQLGPFLNPSKTPSLANQLQKLGDRVKLLLT